MTEKEYTNQDIWNMGAENTANLLNKLTKENQKLKNDKNQQLLDLIYHTSTLITPTPRRYDNIYHRTSKQLENHLKDNGFLVDNVSRSSVGDLSFYHIEFNLSDDEWDYKKTNETVLYTLIIMGKIMILAEMLTANKELNFLNLIKLNILEILELNNTIPSVPKNDN